ncbi:hypothetical protein RclHR1_00810018 [Rhizophagus clarus]|uniref:Uncharacterized protein n=1 Tax=Rhizophagus clarus TaxID=94130 RepID=A0A2Z6RZU8_9GLOM|nr:hypothetical protein RclHR1_00810018 [Rhizophagus clarus]GES95284.1 hypothetical protein GLOIN_2v1594863 [Rhizophagus clarus]
MSYQGIFVPYSGKPQEININIESGDIRQKLNCELSDHITLWAKGYRLCLFCDDSSVEKKLPKNAIATRLVSNLSGMNYNADVQGNILLLDDEKKLTIKDLSSLMKSTVNAPQIKDVANLLLSDLLQLIELRKTFHNFSSVRINLIRSSSNPCSIHILSRDVIRKEGISQFKIKKYYKRVCYLKEDMEPVSPEEWDLIMVQIKNLHRIKLANLEESLKQNLNVLIDEKEAVLRDESIMNNEKNRNIFCRLILIANQIGGTGYPFDDDVQNLFNNIDKLRNYFWNN